MLAIRLSAAARTDIIDLLIHTERTFGTIARVRYEALLMQAIRDIAADPFRPGSAARPELGAGVLSYHLRFSRDRARTSAGGVAKPRHRLIYRLVRPDVIGIGRVLHDAMEPQRHRPHDFAENG